MKRSVLLVGNFFTSSLGSQGVCTQLAEKLADANWRVTVTSRKMARLPRLVDMVSTVWRKRRSFSVAQVDVYSGPAFIWAEAVCHVLRVVGKPYVLTLHGGNLPTFARQRPTRVRRLLRSAAAVTTPSRYLLEYMKKYRSDLYLLPNALNLSVYKFATRSKPRARLVWVRAFHNVYNPSLAAKVLPHLVSEFPDVRLTMVGPDKGDGSLQHMLEIAKQLNVLDRITLPGGICNRLVPEYLNEADIFLNTSTVDNTPVSVLEAMAAGLCVVSTRVGGISYLLEDGFDSLLTPTDNPEAMADAIRQVLRSPELAERLSRNARMKAEQFDWTYILPEWTRLLADTTGR